MTKQYASITPQAIAVWCRQLGHRTFYATYYGLGEYERMLGPYAQLLSRTERLPELDVPPEPAARVATGR